MIRLSRLLDCRWSFAPEGAQSPWWGIRTRFQDWVLTRRGCGDNPVDPHCGLREPADPPTACIVWTMAAERVVHARDELSLDPDLAGSHEVPVQLGVIANRGGEAQ